MYGERARIGLMVPASNTVCEPESARLCPPGVVTLSTRIMFQPSLSGLREMKNQVERAARELSSEDICQAIAFCCTVGSMIEGRDYDGQLAAAISRMAGVPAVTTTSAVKAAFTALGVDRLALATPYTQEITQKEKEILEESGYRITRAVSHHHHLPPAELRNEMIGRLAPEVAHELALAADGPDNQAIFISCTNLAAIDIIEKVEAETGKPVVTSNQATMWLALRTLGLEDRLAGFGVLFEKH